MGKQRRRNRDQAAKEKLFREKGVVVNQPQPAQPGEFVVTQTDLLAQIGALTMKTTILENQLGQANTIIQAQNAELKALRPKVEDVANAISAGSEDEPRLAVVERGAAADPA